MKQKNIITIVAILILLSFAYFLVNAGSSVVNAASSVIQSQPNVGSHIHVEILNHPADGFPIPREPYTFHVVLKSHDNPGKITRFFVQDFSTTKESIAVDLGPCSDCSITFDFTVDFSKWTVGRHELRWHANEPDQDQELPGDQKQTTTTRSQICVQSCSPNSSGRPTPFQGGGGWYQEHDYATVQLLSNETDVRPGGTIIVKAAQDTTGGCVFLNPDFHHSISGPTLDCWSGNGNHTVNIPPTANVGDKLVLYASDGFNAGLFRIALGDGSPQPVRSYEYQSWWEKDGLILPSSVPVTPAPVTPSATPLPVTSTSTRTPAPATLTGIPQTSSVTPTRTNTPIIPTPLSGAIQFAVIGDFGNGSANETLVANLVKSWTPDFIITTGDNNYDSGAASTIDKNIGRDYHEFIGNYVGTYGAGSPTNRFWPSLGNHDWGTAGAVPHLNYFTLPGNERYYDFVQGDVHFFVVDSDSHEPDGVSATSVQAMWLKNALANSTSTWNVVYMHHPPYSSGSNHGSSVGMRWPFKLWGADVVMAGHDHTYERIIVDGLPYFVNGLGGRSIYQFGTPIAGSAIRYNSNYGAMLVEANNNTMTFQFVNINGAVIDSYSISSVPITPAPITPSATVTRTPVPVTPTTVLIFTPTWTNTPVAAVPSQTATTPPVGQNTVEVRVAKGADDVEERSTGSMYTNSSDLELVYDSSNQVVGIRFVGVNIPKGATITNAYLQFKVDETSSNATSLSIQGEASSNALAFTSTSRNVSSRLRTKMAVSWSPVSWLTLGAMGPDQRTPNLAPIVQEIVNQSGWAAGNSLVLIISGTGERVAEAYEGDRAGASLLHVEYTMAASLITIPTLTATTVPTGSPTNTATIVPFPTLTSIPLTATQTVFPTATPLPSLPTDTPSPTATAAPTETPTAVVPTP